MVDYNVVVHRLKELSKSIIFNEDDNPFTASSKEIDLIFNEFFKEECFSSIINLSGHCKGIYDNRSLLEISKEKYQEEFVYRISNIYKIAIGSCFRRLIDKKLETTDEELLDKIQNDISFPVSSPEVYCFECGCSCNIYKNEKGFNLFADYEKLDNKPSQQPCKFPNGVSEQHYSIHVPSGKLLFSNNLKILFPQENNRACQEYIIEKSGYYNNINSDYGTSLSHEFWNNLGLMYLSVGNSSPSVFRSKDKIIIKPESYCTEKGREVKNHKKNEILEGYICTDLWAVCAMDYDLFIEKCKENGIDHKDFIISKRCIVIDNLEAGYYKICDFSTTRKHRKDVYATIELDTGVYAEIQPPKINYSNLKEKIENSNKKNENKK